MLKKIFNKQNKTEISAQHGRSIIMHGHIFKNAGSTLDWSLERNFGQDFCDHRDDKSMRQGGGQYLASFLQQRSNLKAISSHHLCVPLPLMDCNILPIFFFRHPIDRIRSVYNFEKKQPENTPGSIAAKKYSFAEYVEWRMNEEVNPTIRDYQVRYCLPLTNDKGKLGQDDFNNAKDLLNENALVGVVDRYDESVVVFERQLKKYFPNIDLSYVIQNVTNKDGNTKTLEQKVQQVYSDLNGLKDVIDENNRFDLQMYKHSNDLLNNAISGIDNFNGKLEEFRVRCMSLKSSKS